MARPAATDPLHNFRFHITAAGNPALGLPGGFRDDPLQPGAGFDGGGVIGEQPEAGFQAATTPEFTMEIAEYREGVKTYTEKYAGIPTTNDVTLSRGAARADTAFIDWILAAIEGAEYRADLNYFHAIREGRSFPFNASEDFQPANSKLYQLFNGMPIRVKVAADMDATSSDVSLAEIDIAYERFTVSIPTA
jgi:phage tail-like protein